MASFVSASMDSTTAFSPVKNPRKANLDFGQVTGKCVVSFASTISVSACNCSDLDGVEHIMDYGPSTPMHQTPSPKIIPTDTPESIYSQPSLLLATSSTSQGDKEVLQKLSYTTSDMESTLEGPMHHECRKIISEVEQKISDPNKQNFLTLSLAKPNREHQSVKKSDSEVVDLGAEKLALQNVYPASSQACIALHCGTESMGGSLESSRSMSKEIDSDKCPHSPKENGQKILCTDNLQAEEITGFTKIIPRSAKEGPSTPQQPVTHAFSVLKCEDTLGSTFRPEYNSQSCGNFFPAATNNLPMKGLKYIPILQTPMEVNAQHQELTSNKANLCLSLGDGSTRGKKRKSDYSQKQKADLRGYSHDSLSRCCLKKHKVFADKVETDLADLKVSKNRSMQNSGLLPPEVLALELNGNSATNSLINFCQGYPRLTHKNCDSERQTSATVPLVQANVKDLPKLPNITNSVELSTLHGSCQTFSATAQGQVAPMKSAPQRMSSTESDWGKFLALSASPQTASQGDYSTKEILAHYDHRFKSLQAFLKRCDESEQYYCQSLWPLSAAARSTFAVKLEQRAMMLALEEVKEFHRMNTLKVLGNKFSGNTKDAGAATILKFLLPNPS